jgi:hypothetical protein
LIHPFGKYVTLAIVPCFRVVTLAERLNHENDVAYFRKACIGRLYYLVTHLYSSGRIWSTT